MNRWTYAALAAGAFLGAGLTALADHDPPAPPQTMTEQTRVPFRVNGLEGECDLTVTGPLVDLVDCELEGDSDE